MLFAGNAWKPLASGCLFADASLRIVFLACKNPALEFAGDGTSVNRVREDECGFCLLDDRNDFKIVVCL